MQMQPREMNPQQQSGSEAQAAPHPFPEFITPPTMNRDAKSVAIVTPDCEMSSHKLSAVSSHPHNATTQVTQVAQVTPLTQHSLALNHANATNNLNFTYQSFQGVNAPQQRERAQAAPAQIHRPPMHRIGQRVALSQRLKQCAQVSPDPSPSSSFPSSSSFPAPSASAAAVISPEMPVISRHSGNYEIFVGDLSFFCTEMDLYELFCPFGQVLRPRIRRSDKDSRTLMYGFVEMPLLEEAEKAVRELDGSRFQGRDIRVEISRSKAERNENFQQQQRLRNKIREKDVQVHVTLTSQFQHNQVVKPKEDLLRTIFEEYGTVRDIAIKEYTMNKDSSRQEGFLFVSFPSVEEATRAVENLDKTSVRGFLFRCSLSHSNPFDPAQLAHTRTPQTNGDLSKTKNKNNNINNNDIKTGDAEIALSASIDSSINNDANGDNYCSIGDNAGNSLSGDTDKNVDCVDVDEFGTGKGIASVERITEREPLANKMHSVTDKSSTHSGWSSSCPSPSRPLHSSPHKHTHANTLTQGYMHSNTHTHSQPHPSYSTTQQTHTHPLHTHSNNNANSIWAQQRGRDRANEATRLFSPATRYNYPGSSPVPVMSNLTQSMSALSVSGYSPHTSYSQFVPHAPGMSPSHARNYAPPPNSPLTQHVHTVSPLLPHAHCPPTTLPYNANTQSLRAHSNHHTPTLPYAPPMVSPLTPSAITPTLSYAAPFSAPTQQQTLPYSVPPYFVPYAPPQNYTDINGNSVQFSPYPPAPYPYPPRSVQHPPY